MPTQLQVSLSLYDTQVGSPLPAVNPEGTAIDPLLVGELAGLSSKNVAEVNPERPFNIPFAQGITFLGYDVPQAVTPGDAVPLTFYWGAGETPDQDYTIFIQLLDGNRDWAASADAPPVNNFYPTSLWQAGDIIDDQHMLTIPADLPPGTYPLLIGLYEPVNGIRLLRQDEAVDYLELSLEVGE